MRFEPLLKLLLCVDDDNDAEAESDVDASVDGFPRAALNGRLKRFRKLFAEEEEEDEEDEELSCCLTSSKSICDLTSSAGLPK